MTQEKSTKHFLNHSSTLVSDSIQGLCYANPHLRWIPEQKVVYDSNIEKIAEKQVTLIAGGGSGHEPAHGAFVGEGMLSAAVCGHVFASPSASQVLSAIEKVKSPHGTLVIIKNYTGDCLHFGLAVEKARAKGINVETLIVGDDIAVGRKQNEKVGRRGMAATAIIIKCLGALALKGGSLEQLKQLGDQLAQNSITLGVALNHCHVPGTSSSNQQQTLLPNEMELGTGIHNEPGLKKLSIMSVNPLVNHMLQLLIHPKDEDHHYLTFDKNKKTPVVLLINNYGGTPSIEFNVIIKETVELIATHFPHIQMERVLSGSFVTSLNMLGFSLSLIRLDFNNSCNNDDDDGFSQQQRLILNLLDHPVQVPGWSNACSTGPFSPQITEKRIDQVDTMATSNTTTVDSLSMNDHDNTVFRNVMQNVIQKLTNQEFLDTVTKYDTILGDGDFGQTLKTATEAIQQDLNNYPIYSYSKTFLALSETINHSVGGTASAIFCIYLNALANGLNKYGDSSAPSSISLDVWSKALLYALNSLEKYTLARKGDRTMMDVLIPFVETFKMEPHSLSNAVQAAHQGMLSTKTQVATVGRSSYLSNDDVQNANIPDAGAYGLGFILNVIKESF